MSQKGLEDPPNAKSEFLRGMTKETSGHLHEDSRDLLSDIGSPKCPRYLTVRETDRDTKSQDVSIYSERSTIQQEYDNGKPIVKMKITLSDADDHQPMPRSSRANRGDVERQVKHRHSDSAESRSLPDTIFRGLG